MAVKEQDEIRGEVQPEAPFPMPNSAEGDAFLNDTTGGYHDSDLAPFQEGGGDGMQSDNLASGDASDPRGPGGDDPTRQDLDQQEGEAGSGASGAIDADEQDFADNTGKSTSSLDEHGNPINSRVVGDTDGMNAIQKLRFALKYGIRKQTAFGITGIMMITGGFFGFTVASGPAEAITLANTLQKPGIIQENITAARLMGLYGWARTGDFGQTRLSVMQTIMKPALVDKIKANGFEARKTGLGQSVGWDIDTSKGENPLRDLSDSEMKNAFKDEGLKIRKTGNKTWVIEFKAGDISASNKANKLIVGLNAEKRLSAFRTKGYLNTLHGARTKWHPLKRTQDKLTGKFSDRQGGGTAETEEERQQRITELSEEEKGRLATYRERFAASKAFTPTLATAGAVVSIQGTTCLVRAIAGDVAQISKDNLIGPGLDRYIDTLAVASQIQSGDDLTMDQVGNYVKGTRDKNGGTPWKSRALNSLNNREGGESDEDVKNAFVSASKPSKIKEAIDSVGGEYICNPFAQVAGGVVGVGLIVVSGGTSNVIMKSVQVLGGAAAITAATLFVPRLLAEDTPLRRAAGATGGDILANTAKYSAGLVGRGSGGAQMSKAESNEMIVMGDKIEQREFNSKSLAHRVFSIGDTRSLASRLVQQQSGNSPTETVAAVMTSVTKPSNYISGFSSLITPKAYAAKGEKRADTTYDWGFSDYGFSVAELAEKDIQDPYGNAKEVSTILSDVDKANTYADKAMKCFGVNLSAGTDGWDVTTEKDADPSSDEYTNAGCDDKGKEWLRLRMFIFDTQLMESLACSELDGQSGEESCQKAGITAKSSSSEIDADSAAKASEATAGNVDSGDLGIKKLENPLKGASCNCEIDPKGITLHWWGSQGGDGKTKKTDGIDTLANVLRQRGLSVQLGITGDGKVYQLTDKLTTMASHATGGNTTTIGIEIEGRPEDFGKEGIEKYPEKFDAVVKTVQYLMLRYNIPKEKNMVCGKASGVFQHSDFNSCPGATGKSDIDDYYYKEVMKRVK